MSTANVETVSREYAALAERDWGSLADIWHPDVEYEALDPAAYRGFEELKTGFMGWSDLFKEWWVVADEVARQGRGLSNLSHA